MNKQHLLILLERLNDNHICIDTEQLLKLDNKVVETLTNLNNNTIFVNAYKIANKELENKSFIIDVMSKVKDPLIAEVILKQVELDEQKDNYFIKIIGECSTRESALAYRLLLNNKDFTKLPNYKEMIELLKSETIPAKIRFINGIMSGEYVINHPNEMVYILQTIKKCKDENISFFAYKVITDEYLRKTEYYKLLIERTALSKNRKTAETLYKVISDKNMQNRTDYINIIEELFEVLNKDEYYELTSIDNLIISFLKNNNINELKEKLKMIPDNQEIKNKMLVLVLK